MKDLETVNRAGPLLRVRDLKTRFSTPHGEAAALRGVSFDVYPGEVLGVVGESGSGKSVTMSSVLGLLPPASRAVVTGHAEFRGEDLLSMSPKRLREIRGDAITVIFQDPMTSLNPVRTVGWQLSEVIRTHRPSLPRRAVKRKALELLEMTGLPDPRNRYEQFPHELSGGMRQRIMIAIALANEPAIIIADEPTTALDVTVQAQIMELFGRVRDKTGTAIVLITHDLGLVAEMADRVLVMYAGQIVESAEVFEFFSQPLHPYSVALMASRPSTADATERLRTIGGEPPSLLDRPTGCPFHPRCFLRRGRSRCVDEIPELHLGTTFHASACHFSDELAAEPSTPVRASIRLQETQPEEAGT